MQGEKAAVQEQKAKKEEVPKRKFYAKGLLGFGSGFDKVFTGIEITDENRGETEDVYSRPGGGINFQAMLGYHIIPSLMLELGVGYQSHGTTAENGEVTFKRFPIKVTLIQNIMTFKSLQVYIGGGAGYNLAPKYTAKIEDNEESCKYDPSPAFHGLAGVNGNIGNKPLFWFGELRYIGGVSYELKEGSIPNSDFRELNGDGIFVNGGIGYYF